jgi:hypothetical protein
MLSAVIAMLVTAGLLVAAPPPAPAVPGADEPVLALLRELEAGAADLHAFTAAIHYETEDALLGQRVIRKGAIIYHVDAGTDRRRTRKSIAILFDRTIENRRASEKRRHYIVKDGWLVEIDHEAKQFIKRQMVAPDEDFDPLALGEGPIPLPIGQPVSEVLARFDVSLLELPAEGPLAKLRRNPDPVDGLLLIPKAGTPLAEDYRRVELFYDRATRLPVGVNAIEGNGDRTTARLSALRRNPTLTPEELSRIDIEVPKGDWRVDVRPLRGS